MPKITAMRSLMIASAVMATVAAGDASAQRMIAHGPGAPYAAPGAGQTMAPPPPAQPMHAAGHAHGNRWGSKIDGHWWGGMNAPGGWNAYRQPRRGWRVPDYWASPRFAIGDWSAYGLSQPPAGYSWARYYDDAILIDDRGSVYDTVGGIDWDGYDDGYAGDETVYSGTPVGPDDRAGYDQRDHGYRGHRSSGVGGAVAGAAVGGVAGNLIAGRGNRLGGTLIGAGAGAAAGYAIDRGTDGHRKPRYGAGYGQPPVAPGYAPPAPPGYPPPPPRSGWVSPDGTTTVTTTTGGYYGGSTTTVIVQSAPVVTTTTTEIYEDAVTYSRLHKVWRKRVWHKPVWHKPACGCR